MGMGTMWVCDRFSPPCYDSPFLIILDVFTTCVPSSEALVRKDYKYMYWPDFSFEQLFDLGSDPGELEDIFNSTDPAIAKVRANMKKRFEELKNLVKSDKIVTL